MTHLTQKRPMSNDLRLLFLAELKRRDGVPWDPAVVLTQLDRLGPRPCLPPDQPAWTAEKEVLLRELAEWVGHSAPLKNVRAAVGPLIDAAFPQAQAAPETTGHEKQALSELHHKLERIKDALLDVRDRDLPGELSVAATRAIKEAANVVTRATALVGRDLDDPLLRSDT